MTRCLLGQGLEFSYGDQPVLRGVDVRVVRGRATALVGPSGSGKTTLMWLLAGLLEPAAGRVALAEADPHADPLVPTTNATRMRIGMVFQQPALWDHLTAESHLELVLAGKGLPRAERRRRIDRALSGMRLEPLRRRRPGQLSGGERQRLAIARALVVDPEWLFLDEPLAHLDGPIRGELFELLQAALAEARAGVLMATHNAADALRLADDVIVLLAGRVAQAGPAEQVYRRPVSLTAARALGPASEVHGEAQAGVLTSGGQAVLENLQTSLAGPIRMILRPEDVEFRPDQTGPAVVGRCDRTTGTYCLHVGIGGMEVAAFHRTPIGPGTRGRLRLTGGPG